MVPSKSQRPQELSTHVPHRWVFEKALHHARVMKDGKWPSFSYPPKKVKYVEAAMPSHPPLLKGRGE